MLQLTLPTRRAHPSPKSAGPPSTNPHGDIFLHYVIDWHSCGHLLLHILTAPSCFPTTSSSGTHTAQLQPAPSCFPTTSSSATPTSQLLTAPFFSLPSLPQALPRFQRPQPSTYITGGWRNFKQSSRWVKVAATQG